MTVYISNSGPGPSVWIKKPAQWGQVQKNIFFNWGKLQVCRRITLKSGEGHKINSFKTPRCHKITSENFSSRIWLPRQPQTTVCGSLGNLDNYCSFILKSDVSCGDKKDGQAGVFVWEAGVEGGRERKTEQQVWEEGAGRKESGKGENLWRLQVEKEEWRQHRKEEEMIPPHHHTQIFIGSLLVFSNVDYIAAYCRHFQRASTVFHSVWMLLTDFREQLLLIWDVQPTAISMVGVPGRGRCPFLRIPPCQELEVTSVQCSAYTCHYRYRSPGMKQSFVAQVRCWGVLHLMKHCIWFWNKHWVKIRLHFMRMCTFAWERSRHLEHLSISHRWSTERHSFCWLRLTLWRSWVSSLAQRWKSIMPSSCSKMLTTP